MKPDDILSAIGEVDDAYIKKAHQKSLFKAILIFAVIVLVLCSVAISKAPEWNLQLRYNPDSSVITGYAEPEAIIHNSWTSMEYTAYTDGAPVSTTQFRHILYSDYVIAHTENGETTEIIGSNGDSLWPSDYLESQHYANLYISTLYSADLLDRIDTIFIKSETAYGVLNQQLNYIKLEYFERSDRVHRQTLFANGGTPEETVISSRGYSYQNDRITGWKEWDAEGTLLSYADYTYDRNVQTVSTYLVDGTLTGTRVSKYVLGNLKWREYYDADGALVGKEVYRYRVWELFFSLQGFITLFIIASLAATAAIGVWADRIQFGTKLVPKSITPTQDDTIKLIEKIEDLSLQIMKLSDQLETADYEGLGEEITKLNEEIEKMNDHLSKLLNTNSKET